MRCRVRKSLAVAAAAFLVEFAAFAQDAPKPSAAAPSTAPAATTPAAATPPPSPAPPPPNDPGAAAPTNANGSYTVRLHDLERRVNEVKEQIFRPQAPLKLLKETV